MIEQTGCGRRRHCAAVVVRRFFDAATHAAGFAGATGFAGDQLKRRSNTVCNGVYWMHFIYE